MMKAVFMIENKNEGLIRKVYNSDSLQKISEFATIDPELMSKEKLEKNKDLLQDVEVIFSTWGMPALSETEIGQYLPRLKAVFYAAGSVQDFARPFLNSKIIVVSGWAANAVPVAEFTLAQILLSNKGYFQNAIRTKRSYVSGREYSETFNGNYGAKVGILGSGMIGTKVIELLKPFNLEVMVSDPFLSEERAEALGVRKLSLTEIFSECNVISNHIPDMPTTQGILNREHFDRMLPNATFINTGRGAQVVEADLIKALKSVPTRTALIDVTNPEPPVSGSELLKMENIILTSHIAGSMSKEVERMGAYMAEEFVRFANEKELKYSVTLKMLETMA